MNSHECGAQACVCCPVLGEAIAAGNEGRGDTAHAPVRGTVVVQPQRDGYGRARPREPIEIDPWFGHDSSTASVVFPQRGRPWVTCDWPLDVTVRSPRATWDARFFCGYAFRPATADGTRSCLLGVPGDAGMSRVVCRPPPNEREIDVRVSPGECLEFSMAIIAPGSEMFWTAVPPRELLDYVCAKAMLLMDCLLSERVSRKAAIVPMLLLQEEAFLPSDRKRARWSDPDTPGRPLVTAEHAYASGARLECPFVIDLARRRNNFWAGMGLAFLPRTALSTRERILAKFCAHHIIIDVMTNLGREVVIPAALSMPGESVVMVVTSDEHGLRIDVRERRPTLNAQRAHAAAQQQPRRRNRRQQGTGASAS
ncbi:hypothetical protein [Psittacid alphaherpesvirus 1]|uniref:Uncharacterized protein ORFB n=1 Tax=Psittacid herpesvirus 1 (isolate Amazon parrot/-/97-0001/1997) TaxID=670426 RepID=ORFB_PSHV1|nr:protein IB [Psittacid alphaherpesvirus 1]Q6UDL4.1 RecName: Full=Uncharacterized protein ORFB [Psittacid herpesvirus 1 Amazon parrot/1997]AAQ73696.1 hypothetical protein [Psittacid alphaherpesvirus 1]